MNLLNTKRYGLKIDPNDPILGLKIEWSNLRAIINLEGIDGTGKNTVSKRLKELFERMGLKVFTLHFPVYGTPTGDLVKIFLTGDLVDDPTSVDPILASIYYTADRLTYFKNNPQIFTDYDVLIFDRSYMSNFFFQTVKYTNDNNQYMTNVMKYIQTMFVLEISNSPLKDFVSIIRTFQLYHPDINMNFKLMETRGEKLDMHESNKQYLTDIQTNAFKISENRMDLIRRLSNDEFRAYDYLPIRCSDKVNGDLRPIVDIANNIIDELDSKYWL